MKKKVSRTSMRLTLLCSLLSANIAMAGNPVVCTSNYYDATCTPHLTTAYQTPGNLCSTAPGWITVTPPRWIGSKFSDPQCSYTPPPTCPAGWSEASPATWNGTSWAGPNCQAPAPQDPSAMCNASIPSQYVATSSWSQVTDPFILSTARTYAAANGIPSWTALYGRSYDGPTYSLPCFDRNNYSAACYVNGSTVVGVVIGQATSATGGACNH